MATVGSTLAAERLQLGLEIEDVARITKISARSIVAIEADDFDQLPGLVFARNFVKQYAEVVGLDPVEIGHQFDREQNVAPPQVGVAPAHDQRHIHVPSIGRPALSEIFDGNAVAAFVTFVLTIVVCAAAFYAYSYWRTTSAQRAQITVNTTPTPAASKKPPVTSTTAPPPAATSNTPETATAAPPAPPEPGVSFLSSPLVEGRSADLRVLLKAVEPCWVRISGDGQVLYRGTLTPGDAREINAAQSVVLRVGNAGALSVSFNGRDVGELGPKGQIRNVVITPAGAQVSSSDPEPS